MLRCPFGKYHRDKFQNIIHAKHNGISPVGCYPVDYTNYSLGWQIQVYFIRQCLTIKFINDIEPMKTAVANLKVVYEIPYPALV